MERARSRHDRWRSPATRALVVLAIVSALAAGCFNDDRAGRGGPKKEDNPSASVGATTAPGPPQDCRRLPADSMSKSVGSKVELDLPRSRSDVNAALKGFRCVFVSPGKPAEIGSISYTTYPSVAEARAAFEEARLATLRFGGPVVEGALGDRSYATQQAGAWTCTIQSQEAVAGATVAGDSSDAACAWAEVGRRTLA